MAKKKGSKKTGGRKSGSKNKETLEKEKGLATYQQEMLRKLLPFIRSQQKLAEGLVVVLRPRMVKNSKGQLRRTGELKQVRNPAEIEQLFNSKGVGKDFHIVFAKDPNVRALKDIFEMLFGKAPEPMKPPEQIPTITINLIGAEVEKAKKRVEAKKKKGK